MRMKNIKKKKTVEKLDLTKMCVYMQIYVFVFTYMLYTHLYISNFMRTYLLYFSRRRRF